MTENSIMHVACNDIWTGGSKVVRAGTVIKEHHGILDLEKLIEKGAVKVVDRAEVTAAPSGSSAEADVAKPWHWAFNKAELQGKSLDQLNMMALDHCTKHGREPIDPFEDLEEAIAYMTMDVKG